MQNHSFDQFPVKNEEGTIIGIVTSTYLMNKLVKNKILMSDPISKAIMKEFRNVTSDTSIAELGRILTRHQYVVVDKRYIATSLDLLNFMKA